MLTAAEAIRKHGASAEIIMLSSERVRPYYRPMLASIIEKGDVDIILGDNPMEKHRIRTIQEKALGLLKSPRSFQHHAR